MDKVELNNWCNEIINNLIMLKYKDLNETKEDFKELMNLLDSERKNEMIRIFLKNENIYIERIQRSGRGIELWGIFQGLISYLQKLESTIPFQRTGFKSILSPQKITFVLKRMIETEVFFHKIPEVISFQAALTNDILPPDFKPIEWKPSKWSLYEFLERISGYINTTGNRYIPEKVKQNVIPNLFHDNQGREIFLNKPKRGVYSAYVKLIEEILNAIT